MDSQKAQIVITKLAEFLGVEREDITMEDNLSGDLRMSPDQLTDFISQLTSVLDTSKVDLSRDKTVEEVIEVCNIL